MVPVNYSNTFYLQCVAWNVMCCPKPWNFRNLFWVTVDLYGLIRDIFAVILVCHVSVKYLWLISKCQPYFTQYLDNNRIRLWYFCVLEAKYPHCSIAGISLEVQILAFLKKERQFLTDVLYFILDFIKKFQDSRFLPI